MAYGGGTTLTIRSPERPSDMEVVAAGEGVRGPPLGDACSIKVVPPPPDAQPGETAARMQTAVRTAIGAYGRRVTTASR
jgi:hypothetical protein